MSQRIKRQKTNLWFLLVGLVGLAGIGWLIWSRSQPGRYDQLARCLTDKGAKMYGAYWCPHCKEQKEMFGASFKYVKYIECSLPGGRGQNSLCRQAGIKGYPTWEFGDGSRQAGKLSLFELAEKAGCPYDR